MLASTTRKRGRPKKTLSENEPENPKKLLLNIETASIEPHLTEKYPTDLKEATIKNSEPVAEELSTKDVECMTCFEIIPRLNWTEHNKEKHHNLAWKRGDPPLDTTNMKNVYKILEDLKIKQGFLQCYKCKTKIGQVKKFVQHKDLCYEIVSSEGNVICAVCKLEIDQNDWQNHKYKEHNNLTWRQGDPAINLDDESVVKKLLNEAYKAKKPLHCKFCKIVRKSVEGILSHEKICQKSENEIEDIKVECEICAKKVLPVSLESHMKIHKKSKFETYMEKIFEEDKEFDEDTPRRAAAKAKKKLQSLEEEEEMEVYSGKMDKRKRNIDDEYDAEEENVSDLEQAEDDRKRLKQKVKQNFEQKTNARVKPIFLVNPIREQSSSLVYKQAYSWTLNFCEKYYSTSLFENLHNANGFKILHWDRLESFLPTLYKSCNFFVTKNSITTKNEEIRPNEMIQLDLFESKSFYPGEFTIFCGGPITSLIWLPTPDNNEINDQILAVSVINDTEKDYLIGKNYKEPYLIQFYNCGPLTNNSVPDFRPILLFGLAIERGPIWHMEWCPSGTFNSSKLGLLAVAASDGIVYIYSINSLEKSKESGFFYTSIPIVQLELDAADNNEEEKYFPTKISWTRAKGHRYIAVGYSNGLIGIFDLLSNSSLLKSKNSAGIVTILPYQTFQAHVSCVTALVLGHYCGGNRWCYSGSLDKQCTLWDLSNVSKVCSYRRHVISEAIWPIYWPTFIVAEEETVFNDIAGAHTYMKPIREILAPKLMWTGLTPSPSGIKSLSFSEWLNFILHGGNCGDLTGMFAHRLFFNVSSKSFRNCYAKCILSTTKVIRKNDSNEDLGSYKDCVKYCGILFKDFSSENFLALPNSKSETIKKVPLTVYNIRDYPLQSINKVRINPNLQAYQFYAVGYQAGFLRIRSMEFLERSFNPIHVDDGSFTESL